MGVDVEKITGPSPVRHGETMSGRKHEPKIYVIEAKWKGTSHAWTAHTERERRRLGAFNYEDDARAELKRLRDEEPTWMGMDMVYRLTTLFTRRRGGRMTTRIPLAECQRGYLYRVAARGFRLAVFDGETKFIGIPPRLRVHLAGYGTTLRRG